MFNSEKRSERHFVEASFTSNNGKLKGKPDRVWIKNKEIIIEDYKSGSIYDDEEKLHSSILEQMYLYAYLCSEGLSVESIKIRVIPLNKEIFEEEIGLDEIQYVAQTAFDIVDNINNIIDNITDLKKSYNDLASPDEKNCLFCSFKFKCERYWEVNHFFGNSFNIRGKVESIEKNPQYAVIRIMSTVSIEKINLLVKHFKKNVCELIGKEVTICDLKRNNSSGIPESTPRTQIWVND
ncbi:PD-(D/E)XK nuclease family protein [Anaerobacillus sp. CMMVII]|uniref:PD-(D/E)XK nuclease family protein n=1 Tax=Anaerobacillus sp. CMMVII TaxID=2755588 RepID=UPI0021B7FACD|nr:PD-(D/E)XK nuclease family protein [Anaerobacillus sp. CMMVII]MCT8140496.1 PD-(D/E)XK nuclease family protein [Anaerobacillus sp. CMMVII]